LREWTWRTADGVRKTKNSELREIRGNAEGRVREERVKKPFPNLFPTLPSLYLSLCLPSLFPEDLEPYAVRQVLEIFVILLLPYAVSRTPYAKFWKSS
jgi:hypothetical protein